MEIWTRIEDGIAEGFWVSVLIDGELRWKRWYANASDAAVVAEIMGKTVAINMPAQGTA